MNESLIKYLAGLLDADGSLSLAFKADQNRNGHYFLGLRMSLASSVAVDKAGFVDSLPSITEMGNFSVSGSNGQFKTWYVDKRADLEMLLPRIIKHMVIKGRHWNFLLNLWRAQRANRKTCTYDEMECMKQQSKESRRENAGPLKPKNHPTWAWLAGYLDGDGCYSYRANVSNGYKQWTINVSAAAHKKDAVGLEFIQKAFGGIISNQNETVIVWRRSLGYQNRDFALSFLPKLANHSRLKREKIDAMIHHHRQRLSVPGVEKNHCTIDGCESHARGHGLCSKHYQRARRAT